MSGESNESSVESIEEPEPTSRRLLRGLRKRAAEAAGITGEAIRKGTEIGQQAAQEAAQRTQVLVGQAQRRLGEDYYAVLAENPLILDTLSRSDLLVENNELLRTAFNIPWTTTLLWTAAAGGAVALQQQIASGLGGLLHYGPGHVKQWDAVNKFMDTAVGSGHRLKFGHSVEYLPQVVEQFGVEGVPAYFAHLLQDFTTVDGLPIAPDAWGIKQGLQAAGLSPKMATGLVSLSFSSLLGAMAVLALVTELWKFGEAITKKIKTQRYLKTAAAAVENRDYNAAVANYQRALEIERSPAVLMSLGQVYMQRAANRLRAHQAFTEAVTLLANDPSCAVPYGQAQLSIRGLAGIQALATADVLANIHPEHWNDYVRDLVNATVFSFASCAVKQAKQRADLIPDTVVLPSSFSAAINYYLAARSACYYPLAEERQEVVTRNLQSGVRTLGLVAQYDEAELREPTVTIRQLWANELLPPEEIEIALAAY